MVIHKSTGYRGNRVSELRVESEIGPCLLDFLAWKAEFLSLSSNTNRAAKA